MGGGLMQLVAYGAQDIYLTGNPQITFFKVVYRRHTNFSMECIKQSFKGAVGNNARVVATLARNGDLVHDCFLKNKAKASGGTGTGTNVGHQIINNIEVEIGGQLIDKHYGHWMETHAELTEVGRGTAGSGADWQKGGNASTLYNKFQLLHHVQGVCVSVDAANNSKHYFIHPINFWFCRHVGLSLPLIALQYHEVNKMTFNFIRGSGVIILMILDLWCNYIYLIQMKDVDLLK